MNTLLLEIGCEDLPARYVLPLAEALSDGIQTGLKAAGLPVGSVRTFATPRRLAVLIDGVPAVQPDQQYSKKGPKLAAAYKDGAPTPAALGFAKSCGVDFAALQQEDGQLVFIETRHGQPTASLLQGIFDKTLQSMDALVPKRMRWGSHDFTFVRPVQWLCALLGSDVVPLQAFALTADRTTYGHRFHAPAAIELRDTLDYVPALAAAFVVAEVAVRREHIRNMVQEAAQGLGGTAKISEDLLDEVTSLVEYPQVVVGRFEETFLQLPSAVIVATVETNQRYFTVFDGDQLLPFFITIANIASTDIQQVVTGNERVVRPRLSDALFFYQQDQKQPLEAFLPQLDRITFHKDLAESSVGDKARRIQALAKRLHDDPITDRAAYLCKADLVSKMVYEFPELQGLMGGDYARKSGESAEIAEAIAQHYQPQQQGSALPSSRSGQAVSLADKLDTLISIFATGHKPSATKDPFGLRRCAVGVLRILIEGGWNLDLAAFLKPEVLEFVLERQRAYLLERTGCTAEAFEAVRALNISVPMDFAARLEAVHQFWQRKEAAQLAAAHKRVRNILKGVESQTLRPEAFTLDVEKTLLHTLQAFPAAESYQGKLLWLAEHLAVPVDAFFTNVMVNDADEAIRSNRLALLQALDKVCREVADISVL
jgi:glycyl-tRNA synthetase beta chain